jgi:MFS family permease
MYQIENAGQVLRRGRGERRRLLRLRVGRNVALLGLVSLLTDVSAEMVATVLPLYLMYNLGLSPLLFGVVDGAYQGATALVRLAGGFIADRWRRYKEVAAVGYALSAFAKPAFLLVGSAWGALTAIVLVDRVGKGIRTAPRDALISLSSSERNLATAFGVHRALDTAGAMIGPVLAFGILVLVPGAFDAVFVVSFCFALLGLGVLLLFVENRTAPPEGDAPVEVASIRAGIALVTEPRFRRVMVIATILSLTTMSDAFVYLQLQRRADLDPTYLPLLFVGTAAAYMLLAVPVGALADRIGRGRVFLIGYALLLAVYLSLLLPAVGVLGLVLALVVLGAYYAATDGVLMALVSVTVPAELRASGLAALVTATSTGRLLASILFGALWTAYSAESAVAVFACGLALATAVAAIGLRKVDVSQRGAAA